MKFHFVFFLALFCVVIQTPAFALNVTNYSDGTVIDYPVALIYGTTEDASLTEIQCENTSSQKSTRVLNGSAFGGRFKVLAELIPGENTLVLKSGPEEKTLKLTYRKNENPLVVRMIYMTDSTGNTEFQSQKKDDPQNFRGKLDTAAKLMQTFTAERMNDAGYGRKTFNLELDENGDVIVHVVKGKLTAEEYYRIQEEHGDGQWYVTVYEELRETYPMAQARNLVIPAYSRFVPGKNIIPGHTALGGSAGLAMFGSANIFTWPDSLNEVTAAFQDSTPIDRAHFQDDSVGRSCFWGAASTTMGAALHEIGHTFDLPHSNDVQDIMLRGHDRFNRAFLMREAPHAYNPEWYTFRDDEIALWGPKNAPQLNWNPYFQDGAPTERNGEKVHIEMDHQTGILTVKAEDGIQFIGCVADDPRVWIWTPEMDADAEKPIREKTFRFWDIAGKTAPEGEHFEFFACDANYQNAGVSLQVVRQQKNDEK